jgi:signal recognition particle receptor subunit beta
MATLNYAFKEISCKIVYYGCGLCGKTTNLQHVHKTVPGKFRGELVSLATEQDRTLFFDFLPLDLGEVKGFKTKFQLYTVPGQVYYNATRKLVLRGVDGIVFVADSQRDRLQENIESFENLKANLTEYGYRLQTGPDDDEGIPWVLQLNKRDMPQICTREELMESLQPFDPQVVPVVDSVAVTGVGVKETLKGISSLVIQKLNTGRGALASPSKPATPVPGPSAAPARPATPSPVPEPAAPSDDEYEPMEEEEEGVEVVSALPPKATPTPAAPERKSPTPPPVAAEPAAAHAAHHPKTATPEAPSLLISQDCVALGRGSRTGKGALTLSKIEGTDDYQLTGSLKFMGMFTRSVSKRLISQGAQGRSLDGTTREFVSFVTAAGQDGPEMEVLALNEAEKALFVRYNGFGGEICVMPPNYESMPV